MLYQNSLVFLSIDQGLFSELAPLHLIILKVFFKILEVSLEEITHLFKIQKPKFSTIACVTSFQASWPSCAKVYGEIVTPLDSVH